MEVNIMRISFLITHYNRPNDLLKCITAIQNLNIVNAEIVVCDDASDNENLEKIRSYPIDQLLLSQYNHGLAANINKGIAACKGEYIIYCQEDFMLIPKLKEVLKECLKLLDQEKIDMIRFTSNFNFNKVLSLTTNISLIPKFSFENIFQNYYQYSDHPFITKKSFYTKFGLYLEQTSGRYGETEYAIRIMKSKAKIGITNERLALYIEGSQSVLVNESAVANNDYPFNKKWIRLARGIRLYLELILYRNTKRGLCTYKNFRKEKGENKC